MMTTNIDKTAHNASLLQATFLTVRTTNAPSAVSDAQDDPALPPSLVDKRRLRIETVRKMLLAMAEDPRVVVLKLADRLHNMRIFSFQAEDGIRDHCVTGVQTCALPI